MRSGARGQADCIALGNSAVGCLRATDQNPEQRRSRAPALCSAIKIPIGLGPAHRARNLRPLWLLRSREEMLAEGVPCEPECFAALIGLPQRTTAPMLVLVASGAALAVGLALLVLEPILT